METIMLFATIVAAIATAVIAVATITYVVITRKLWLATHDTAQRTLELVRQSQESLRLQLIVAFLQETGRSVVRPFTDRYSPETDELFNRLCKARGKEVRLLLRESFPAEWAKIEATVDGIEQQIVEHQKL